VRLHDVALGTNGVVCIAVVAHDGGILGHGGQHGLVAWDSTAVGAAIEVVVRLVSRMADVAENQDADY
jgi:hypothetical protein